ncbi:MAG: acylphosphatase [Candidatus Altiarchaeota archaeon]
MVSAKFHVIGEDGDWFRIRLQEEIHVHGLEGSVLRAAAKNLVVVVEGERSKIKRMYEDVAAMCPKKARCADITFEKAKRAAKAAVYSPEQMTHALLELERKMTRIDQNIAKILANLEGGWRPSTEDRGLETEPKMEVEEEAASGFASMFGD